MPNLRPSYLCPDNTQDMQAYVIPSFIWVSCDDDTELRWSVNNWILYLNIILFINCWIGNACTLTNIQKKKKKWGECSEYYAYLPILFPD